MDGSFPLQRDPDQASPAPGAQKWRQEIADAKAGVRAKLSTKAAALYIGVHYTTLRDWVREGRGPQPIQNPGKPGTTAQNQHLGFTLEALDSFLATRSGEPITRGKRTDTGDVLKEAERIEALIALREAEDRLAKSKARARRLGIVCFKTLTEALEIQPWSTVDGRIAGHAWAVDDATFNAADEDQWEGSLEEALAQPWINAESRQPYQDAFVAVLSSSQHAIEAARSRQRASDMEERLSGNVVEDNGGRPFEKRERSALSTRENGLMGGRPGRPPKAPGPLALTVTEEEELAKAKAGAREWVGPGVAAYMLGISKDALKKRRQRNEGLIPEHRQAKSNRQGAQYRWSSVVRCAGAERIQSDILAQRLDDIVAVLKKRGLEGLEQDLPWAYNHADRLIGLASLHPQLPARALTVLEALESPWVSSEARQPFHDWVMGELDSAAERAAKATD